MPPPDVLLVPATTFGKRPAPSIPARASSRTDEPGSKIFSLVKNHPNEATESVGDRTDGLGVAEARDEPAIHDREDGALRLHRGVGRLIQDASHLAVALETAVTVDDDFADSTRDRTTGRKISL